MEEVRKVDAPRVEQFEAKQIGRAVLGDALRRVEEMEVQTEPEVREAGAGGVGCPQGPGRRTACRISLSLLPRPRVAIAVFASKEACPRAIRAIISRFKWLNLFLNFLAAHTFIFIFSNSKCPFNFQPWVELPELRCH